MVYKLFSCCVPVKGFQRSLIADLQRHRFDFIPNSLCHILYEQDEYVIEELKKRFPNSAQIIDEYFDFLQSNEYIFATDHPDHFPKLDLGWYMPNPIINSIIQYSKEHQDYYSDVISQLSLGGCRFVDVWFHKVDYSDIKMFIENFAGTSICSLELYIELTHLREKEAIEKMLLDNEKRISKIFFFNEIMEISQRVFNGVTIYTFPYISFGPLNCGNIFPQYFVTNVRHFTESQHHNTCLNRKISIDVDGNIKNCPSMSKSYGNIRDTKLIDVVNNPEFQKVWHIKKDEITKCKDCEFRHVCTDCRAYLENPDDQYSAPLKCGYNPYTCEWEEWSTNPLKQKAIEFYGMQDLVKKS